MGNRRGADGMDEIKARYNTCIVKEEKSTINRQDRG